MKLIRTYPKFLKKSPSFFGLDFYDLAVLMVSLFISMIFNFRPIISLLFAFALIGVCKFLRRRFDLTALMISKKSEIFIERRNTYDRF